MKKIILCLLFCALLIPKTVFANDNFIYSINVSRDEDLNSTAVLNIKSDYKTKVQNRIDEIGREYFDIKDASLKENFTIQYNNAKGVESVIAQQIGNKVRIYIKGDDIEDVALNFNNVENQPYPDKSAGYALLVFGLIVFGLFRVFKKKATRLKIKAQVLQNVASKAVYKNLMEKKAKIRTSDTIYDNKKLTLNSLKNRNMSLNNGSYNAFKEHQRQSELQRQRFINRVAM